MKLSKVERWILINQYEILEHVNPDRAEEYQTMQEVLRQGYEIEYDWKTQFIADDDDVVTEEKCRYVIDVMAMYDALQISYRQLADKEGIDARALKFSGFDGNNEGEYYSYANFLRTKEDKFTTLEVEGDGVNSHFPTLDMYNRMLNAWHGLASRHELTGEQIKAVLDERIHPDNR